MNAGTVSNSETPPSGRLTAGSVTVPFPVCHCGPAWRSWSCWPGSRPSGQRGLARDHRSGRRPSRRKVPSSTTSGHLVFGTVLSSLIAILIAIPHGDRGGALHLSHLPLKPIAMSVSYLTDLLAAIPSIIYGIWGSPPGPASVPVTQWLSTTSGFIPFFDGPASTTGRTMLVAGVVLTLMILPIIGAVAREVFQQTPRAPGGCPRPRRDPLEMIPHGRCPSAARPWSLARCSVSAGRSARRWP